MRKKKVKPNCTTCKHAKFDEKWGEYKCKFFAFRVLNPYQDCAHYTPSDKNK